MSKTRCSEQLSLFSVGEQEVTVDFAGGQIVTDAGLLAVAQLVEGLGILDDLADRWPDPRCQAMVTHTGRELLALQIYQYLAGYFDFNDANFTRHDPLFKALAGVSPSAGRPLASGSTLGRFLHTYTRREVHKPVEERDVIFEQRHAQIQRIRLLNEYLVELFAKTRPRAPTHVILDLDGTADAAHGQQQLTFWNMHYDQNQYFPLHLFDAVTGFPLAAWLRPGNVHDSLGAVETLQSVVEPLRRCFPGLTIFVRGDGAFGTPEMLDYCEHEGLLYAFGYSNHQGLKPRTAGFAEQLELYYRFYPEEGVQRFDEIRDYRASSWSHPRRLLVKTEINFRGPNQRVVVTNLSGSARGLYQGFYVQRGNVPERPIGEMKNGLGSDRLSSSRFLANFQKLLAHVLSYAIVVLFREALAAGANRDAMVSDLSGLCDAGRSTAQASPTPVVTVGRNEAVPVARVAVVRVAVVRVPVNAIGASPSTAGGLPCQASSQPGEIGTTPSEATPRSSRLVPSPEPTLEQVLQASQQPRTSLREVVRWEVATLRNQLFKVGALVKASVRRIWFHFSSHWPRQELFCRICQAVSDYVERYRQRYLLPTGPPG